MKTLLALLFATSACGTTIYADHYASDCDADNQCVRISVGDQCACTCDLASINERDYDNYITDLERIGGCRNTCSPNVDGGDPDAAPNVTELQCGQGVGSKCSAGKCAIYTISP
jgi:hypothetical protein